MFFDENYVECYYRDQTIKNITSTQMDALVVIGTALATGGAKRIVYDALEKQDVPVIEFNMSPVIDEGFALSVTEKCETALDKFFNEFYRLSSLGAANGAPT